MAIQMGKSIVDVLKAHTNNNTIESTADGLDAALTAIEGEITGAQEIFGIDITATEDAETHVVTYATTKTYAAILAAITAGKVLDITDNNGVSYTVGDVSTSDSGFAVNASYTGTAFSQGVCTMTVTTLTITGTASSSTVAVTASTGTGGGGGGSGNEPFIIDVISGTDDQENPIYTTEKTVSQIISAILAEKVIKVRLKFDNDGDGEIDAGWDEYQIERVMYNPHESEGGGIANFVIDSHWIQCGGDALFGYALTYVKLSIDNNTSSDTVTITYTRDEYNLTHST